MKYRQDATRRHGGSSHLVLPGVPGALAVYLFVFGACRAPEPKVQAGARLVTPSVRAHAGTLTGPHELPLGTNATAKVGDHRLWNEEVEFVFDNLEGKQGFAATGGNLIDARLRPSGVDALNQTFLYLDDTFPRQAVWQNARSGEHEDGSASLTLEGPDTNNAALWLETVHRLAPRGSALHMRTTVTNRGSTPVAAYELGDCLQWGKTEHFAPGLGYDMHSKRVDLAWVAGVGDGVSYGLFSRHGPMHTFSGSSWTDVIHKKVDLAPGESQSFERDFVVGSGDVTSVLAASGHVRTRVLSGFIRQSNGEPVAGGEVVFTRGGEPFAMTTAYPGGYFEAALPKGTYEITVAGLGLRSDRPETLTLDADTKHDFSVQSGGQLRFSVREGGQAIPAKVSIWGVGETKNPSLGKSFQAAGAGNVTLSVDGTGAARLPPGRYKVFASRGIEYDIAEREIEMTSNAEVEVLFELHRVVDTRGYLSADFHQHQRNSFDSAMSLEDRTLTNLAEGLEIIVPTDHDFVTDMRPVLERIGLSDALLTVSGAEATTHTFGHYAGFPVTPNPALPRNGAPETWNRRPPEIIADLRAAEPQDKVVQVNHPRADMTGYFELLHLDDRDATRADPDLSTDFDAIEVMNGKRIKEAERVLADWMHFMAQGKRYTATGNSDSHQVIYQEVGYPRNFIRVEREGFTAQALVEAVKRRHAVIVTNGPFVELFAGTAAKPAQVGDTVKVKGSEVEVRYRVQAAPWIDVTSFELWQDGQKLQEIPVPPSGSVVRLEGALRLKLKKPSYVFAIARGARPLEPVLPTQRNKPTLPFGFTNPIFFDK